MEPNQYTSYYLIVGKQKDDRKNISRHTQDTRHISRHTQKKNKKKTQFAWKYIQKTRKTHTKNPYTKRTSIHKINIHSNNTKEKIEDFKRQK